MFVNVCFSFLDQTDGKIPQLLEVIGCVIFISPLEAQPFNVFLDGFYIFYIFLGRVGIIETKVAYASIALGYSEIQTNSLGMSDVQVSIRFRREASLPTIQVVLVEPGKLARIAEIGTTLDAMQQTVGGDIEAYYPFEEQVCIVCNEEGKINGLPLNRAIRDADTGDIADIIAGTFFICDCSGESFGSLSSEQQKRYLEKYRLPERFFRSRDSIESVPFKPKDRNR